MSYQSRPIHKAVPCFPSFLFFITLFFEPPYPTTKAHGESSETRKPVFNVHGVPESASPTCPKRVQWTGIRVPYRST